MEILNLAYCFYVILFMITRIIMREKGMQTLNTETFNPETFNPGQLIPRHLIPETFNTKDT